MASEYVQAGIQKTHSQFPAQIASLLSEELELVVANTPALREEVFRLRYRIYCQELGFERAENYPDGLERDAFDSRAVHCFLRQRTSGRAVACVRLVLCDPLLPESPFPFEIACRNSLLSRHPLGPTTLSRQSFGEVSRLAMLSELRRCQGVNCPEIAALVAPALYFLATAIVLEAGLQRVYTMMEPRLARHLRRFGLPCTQIGGVIDYHGLRGPFCIDYEQVMGELNEGASTLLRTIRESSRMHLQPLLRPWHQPGIRLG